MNNLEDIKKKINILIKDFKNKKINTPDEIMNRFKELFNNEYFEINKTENRPYFKWKSESIYIKNGYGIGISKVWGPMDFSAKAISHEGVDVYIFSEIANEYVTLFDESERNTNLEKVERLYDIDLSIKNLKKEIRNDIVFKTLPDEIKNKDEIVNERYRNLKIIAEDNFENDIKDELISYYGGLDVTIHSTEYYLYNSLLKHIEDENFMKKVIPLFVADFPDYINDEIDICEYALYMIYHKEDFYKWADLTETMYVLKLKINEIEKKLYNYLKKKRDLQVKVIDSLDEYTKLQTKKYNILELIIGKRKSNAMKIEKKIGNLKSELETINIEIEKFNDINNLKEEFEVVKNEKEKLSTELERPFKDFTLNLEFEDETYINGKYRLNVSLDKLVKKEGEYNKKLKELQRIKSYSVDKNIKLKKENEIEYSYK